MKLDSDYSRAVVFDEIFSFLTLRECSYLCVPGFLYLYLDDECLPSIMCMNQISITVRRKNDHIKHVFVVVGRNKGKVGIAPVYLPVTVNIV